MTALITAIGTASPPYRQAQQKVQELMSSVLTLTPVEKRMLRSLYNATGINYRHSVLSDFCKNIGEFTFFPNDMSQSFPSTAMRMEIYKDCASNLAVHAIKDCLKEYSELDLQEITHLVTVSCTGMYAPGIDIEIIQALNLRSTVHRTAVNFMGCYGAFNGIKVANAICRADVHAKILVVSVELCTIHFQKNVTQDNLIASAIFADGAAAVLIEAKTDRKKYFSLENFYCDLIPQASKEMAWNIGDTGFDMILTSYVPEAIESGIQAFTEKLLKQAKVQFSDIDLYAIHPGGMKILQACENALHLTTEKMIHSYDVLRQFGNMSSATILYVLKNVWDKTSDLLNEATIFSCAFGPGLTLESMLLKTSVS